jgi:hypothetical protein
MRDSAGSDVSRPVGTSLEMDGKANLFWVPVRNSRDRLPFHLLVRAEIGPSVDETLLIRCAQQSRWNGGII